MPASLDPLALIFDQCHGFKMIRIYRGYPAVLILYASPLRLLVTTKADLIPDEQPFSAGFFLPESMVMTLQSRYFTQANGAVWLG